MSAPELTDEEREANLKAGLPQPVDFAGWGILWDGEIYGGRWDIHYAEGMLAAIHGLNDEAELVQVVWTKAKEIKPS